MNSGKRIRVATIVCWCIVAASAAGLAVWAVTGSLFGIPTGIRLWELSIGGIELLMGDYELRGTQTVPSGGADSLVIDWVAGGVTISPYDGADIELLEYAQRDLEERERMHVETSNGTVMIRFAEEGRIKRIPPKRLEVRVPRELCGRLALMGADATSADISVTGIQAGRFTAKSTSGDIKLSDIRADKLQINATSGNITVVRAVCGDIDMGSTSGDLSITESGADALITGTTSGNQKLCGTFGNASLGSTSGDILLENGGGAAALSIGTVSGNQTATGAYSSVSCGSTSGGVNVTSAVVPDVLEIGTTSGDVTVTIPDNGGITVSHSTVSGSLKSDVPMMLGSGGALAFSTVSGDVRILAA